jgi:hypothetical protein
MENIDRINSTSKFQLSLLLKLESEQALLTFVVPSAA